MQPDKISYKKVGYIYAILLSSLVAFKLALKNKSRNDEKMADLFAARISDPESQISALRKIESVKKEIFKNQQEFSKFLLEESDETKKIEEKKQKPFKFLRKFVKKLFSDHPETKSRLEYLERYKCGKESPVCATV